MRFLLWALFGLTACTTSSEEQLNVNLLIQQATEAFQAGNYHHAIHLSDSALALNKNTADAHFMRGRVFFELQQWEHAESAYLNVIMLNPDYSGVQHNLGNIYYGQRQYRKALTQYIQATDRSTSPRSWHAVGATYQALHELDSAALAFDHAIRLDTLYVPVYTSFGDLLEQQGRYSEALKYTMTALEMRPDHLPDQLRQARILLRLGHIDEAIALLQFIIPRYPHHSEPRYILGQAWQQSGFPNQSSKIFEAAESLRVMEQRLGMLANAAETQSTNFQTQIDYAIALRQAGRLQLALKKYLVAQALRPDNWNLQFHIATIEADLGEFEHAQKRLTRILDADSSYALAWLSLVDIYTATNQPSLAEQAWQEAVRMRPDHPAIRQFRE